MVKKHGIDDDIKVTLFDVIKDKLMQSPKGIFENVLVKIDNFIFLVDFVILDIVDDDKVSVILERPMLAIAHARIDIFGKKISLHVEGKKVLFNANVGIPPLSVTSVCAIHNFKPYDLFPENSVGPFGILSNSESEMGNGLEDFSRNLEDLLDEQAPQFGQNEVDHPPLQP
ncbi:putative reverse transcriptase domain-containing protein [Tanacetum coccineum]